MAGYDTELWELSRVCGLSTPPPAVFWERDAWANLNRYHKQLPTSMAPHTGMRYTKDGVLRITPLGEYWVTRSNPTFLSTSW